MMGRRSPALPRVVTSLIDHATRGPLASFPRDWIAGPSHTFFISWPCHLSANEIMALLDRRGIRRGGIAPSRRKTR